MKNIIIIFSILLTNLVFSQTYPLNGNMSDAPNGSYFKDLDGELDPYVGTWKGTWEGKTLIIEFKKIKYYLGDLSKNDGVYQDRIFGERKVISGNGTVEIDRITNFDEANPEFRGIGSSLKNINQKQISFYPKNMCGKSATLDVNFINPEKTQMSLHFKYDPSYLKEDCQYYNLITQGGDLPINFPKDITLIKQ